MTKRFLICLMLLLFCMSTVAFAEEEAAPVPAFSDAFDVDELNAEVWAVQVADGSEGYWAVKEGVLEGGINAYADGYVTYIGGQFTDVAIECDVTLASGNAISLIARMQENNGGQGYQLFFDQWDGLKICKRPYEVLLNRGAISPATLYHVRFTVQGTTLTADITDVAQELTFSITCEDATYTEAGYVGFCVFGMGTVAQIDNVAIYDLSEK